jgi:hypothetical protein
VHLHSAWPRRANIDRLSGRARSTEFGREQCCCASSRRIPCRLSSKAAAARSTSPRAARMDKAPTAADEPATRTRWLVGRSLPPRRRREFLIVCVLAFRSEAAPRQASDGMGHHPRTTTTTTRTRMGHRATCPAERRRTPYVARGRHRLRRMAPIQCFAPLYLAFFYLGVPQFQSLLRWPTTNRWPTTSGGSRKRSASAVGRCASRCTMRWRRMRTASGATNAFLPRGSVSARTKAHGAAGIPANECTCSIPTGNSAIRYRGGSNRAWSSASQMTRGEEQ